MIITNPIEDGAKAKKKKNKDGTERRPGSGRTKGSYSFIRIKLSDLTGKFIDPEMPVIISRKWAEQVGLAVESTTDAGHLFGTIEGTTPTTKIGVNVIEFD